MTIMREPFHVIVKPRGALCNLACDYCFYLSKKELYPDADCSMDETTLETFIRDYISSQDSETVTFSWQGGEPTLMGLSFFSEVITLQKKYNTRNQKIVNAVQTNGILITDEWAKFLKTHNFLVGISIDGPRQFHDRVRKYANQKGTFDKVIESLAVLKKHHVDVNVLACISQANVDHPLEVYRFFRDSVQAEFIQLSRLLTQIVLQRSILEAGYQAFQSLGRHTAGF